jgi:hypothetical protein
MNPYRTPPSETRAARTITRTDDAVVPVAILVVGLIGLAVGVLYARTFESGLGTLLTLFGAYTTVTALRRR